uniref:Uncharacterized protein n=1 Tax=Panagrolaimus sp. JU765 TaxID=591449 RepID=A0AC34RMK3_9BILA
YPWYDAPNYENGTWQHWNHEWFSNWDRSDTKTYPTGFHVPPDDIGSLFFPSLGPYSSRDPLVIDQHMKWIASAKINVVVVSWIPEEKTDPNSFSWDSLVPLLMDSADNYGLKLSFHLEPYEGRTAASVKNDIIKIIDKYGNHSAFYRTFPKNQSKSGKALPLFYVYDSYMVSTDD